MNKDYLPIIVLLIFFLYNVTAGIMLYLGIPTTNTIPPDPISLGQLLFLIFILDAPLICVFIYAFYKQKKKVEP